jgi:hypothetical protein
MARATSRDALDAWLARDAAGWPETREAWRDVVARAMDVATPTTTTTTRACASAALRSDFNVCALGGGLSRAPRVAGARARGRFVVQMDEWRDVGRDARRRRADEQCRRSHAQRCLTLSLTDGARRMFAVEYEAVPRLSGEGMRAGAKIALTDPYVGEDGTIWLERATTELLGGVVERLERARTRAMAVFEAPNRPGVGEGDRVKAATRAAWEEEANEARALDGARDVEGAAPRVVVTPNAARGVVPDSQVVDILEIGGEDDALAGDARAMGAVASPRRSTRSSLQASGEPIFSSRERSSVPSSSAPALDDRAMALVQRVNESAVKGLWTYLGCLRAARASLDDKSAMATVHAWITRTGRLEVQEDARPPLWRVKIQISDPTGAASAYLRTAPLDAFAGTTATAYVAADARERESIEASIRKRLEEFCGRIRLASLKEKIMVVQKLDAQPTGFKPSVVGALRARKAYL